MIRRHAWTALGVALILLGVGLYVAARPGPGDYGWFAYTPLDNRTPAFESAGELVLLTRGHVVGAAVTVVGLLVLTAVLAYRSGRRGTRS